MEAASELAGEIGVSTACTAIGVARSGFYHYRRPKIVKAPLSRPPSHRALSEEEHGMVLDVLHSERYMDKAPGQIYASLLDQGDYLCSIRTMYRILASEGELRERRNQLRHPVYEKPELLATGPNQVWSWDITKLKGPVKWTYYYLYVLLDIFSRYVADDNPFSESQFKTMKYRPDFPERFGCIEDARSFCCEFFRWYNTEHYHSGLGLLTPQMVHYGNAEQIVERRKSVLLEAYMAHPERFVRKSPEPPALPAAVWINPPEKRERRDDLVTKFEINLSQNC